MPIAMQCDSKLVQGVLVEQDSSLPLGTADAIVVALAERFRAVNIATLDRRHFSIVRADHIQAFTRPP